MTLREIMTRAHELAKTYEGHYQARLSLGLREAWAEAKETKNIKEYVEVKIERAKGYSGKMSRKGWVAQITGIDYRGNLDREFSEAVDIDWSNYKIKRKKGWWTETHHLTVGIWEVVEYEERKYFRIEMTSNGAVATEINIAEIESLVA